jgi:hypothetical protein
MRRNAMGKGSKLGEVHVLRGIEAMGVASGAETSPPPATTTRPKRGKRGPVPDPDRGDLMPVLYRVRPNQYEALTKAAERRAAARWEEELRAAKQGSRPPRALAKRKDASEVLREVLDAWIEKGGK